MPRPKLPCAPRRRALGAVAAALVACAGPPFAPRAADPPAACAVRRPPAGGPAASAPGHELAIAALGGDPAATDASQWEEVAQAFWPGWRVYRIVDPVHPSRVAAAAVDARGRVVELTNRRPLARENAALACFNALSRGAGVRVGRRNAEAYLAFFLWTQVPEIEQFLRGREDAEAVLAHPWQSRYDEYLLAQLERTIEPAFELRATANGFAATAFDWRWSRGVVHRYDLSVTADGAVRFRDSPFGSQPPREGPTATATCFAVHPDGLVLTASHAVAGAHAITLRFASGEERAATLARAEPGADLALLRVEGALPAHLPLARREPEIGEVVFTLGFPGPRLLWSDPEYAAGTVRGRGADPSLIETDVPARAGSSGGPLVDAAGFVLGVLSRITATPDDRWRGTLAVRAAAARALLDGAPEAPPPAASREEAIARVRAAICEVEAELVGAEEPAAGP
jgi:S1-C subfamily serine protease